MVLGGAVQPLMDGSGSPDPLHSVWIAWSRQLCVIGSPKIYAQPRQGSLKRRRPWRPCCTYEETVGRPKNWGYAQSSGPCHPTSSYLLTSMMLVEQTTML
jgi:hypothetical protein